MLDRILSIFMIMLCALGILLVFIGPIFGEGYKIIGYIFVIIPIAFAGIMSKVLEAKKETNKQYTANTKERTLHQARAISKKYVGIRDFTDAEGNVMHGDAFEVEFEYEFSRPDLNFSTKFKATTFNPVNDKDAAVCMWMSGKDMLIDIEVYGSYCDIKTDLSQYYEEEIYLIDEDDVPKLSEDDVEHKETAEFENKNAFTSYLILGFVILIAAIFPILSMLRTGDIFGRNLIFLIIVILISFILLKRGFTYRNKITIMNSGVDQETAEFICYLDTTIFCKFSMGYIYIVEFTFVGENGVKITTKDRVNNSLIFDRLKNMEVIPIKVYNNHAVLNIDRIQK